MTIYGVILAGGSGLRLGGVDKAKIRLGKNSLFGRVHRQLLNQTDHICITNADEKTRSGLPDTVRHLVDTFSPQIGPLGGISTGYEWATSLGASTTMDYLLVAPVDTPDFPDDFAQRAMSVMDAADVVVARYNDQEYPTCSLWRCGAASRIGATRPDARTHAIRGYLEIVDVAYMDFATIYPRNPFKNVNKISDLLELDGRAT